MKEKVIINNKTNKNLITLVVVVTVPIEERCCTL